MERRIDLSLVIACYNEGPTLQKSLETIAEILSELPYKWEIICIDDKSRDDSAEIVEKFSKRKRNITFIAHKKNVGRGGTVKEGMLKARGAVVGYIDVDLEISAVYVSEFVRVIKKGADVAIANRIYKEDLTSLPRWIASRGYLFLVRTIFGVSYSDTEAGYKFFNRKRVAPILKKTRDKKWFFDTEIMLLCNMHNLSVKEIPVLFLRRMDKKSTVRLISDSVAYLKSIQQFRTKNKR